MTLTRKAPIRRRSSRASKPPAQRCDWPTHACRKRADRKIADSERYCKAHAVAIADALVGDYVKRRDGYRCRLRNFNDKPCSGPEVYWCHLIPKGRYGSVRWLPLNAVTGCRDHHMALDTAPIEKDAWCERELGREVWEDLRKMATERDTPKVADVILRFRQFQEGDL